MKFQKRFLLNDGNSLPTRRLMTAFYQHELPNCPKDYNTDVGIVGISTSSNVLRNCYTRQQQQLPKYLIRSYPHYDTNGIEVNDTSRHFTTTTTTTIRKQQQQRCNKTFVTTPTLHVESTFRYPYSSKGMCEIIEFQTLESFFQHRILTNNVPINYCFLLHKHRMTTTTTKSKKQCPLPMLKWMVQKKLSKRKLVKT